jgi:adenine-specific DNA-methyltransferase
VRYIGNKTRLLDFIGRVLSRRGIRGGRAIDPFSGTASVARELKRRRFEVLASDIMEYGYTFARAYVQVTSPPESPRLAARLDLPNGRLETIIAYLNSLPPEPGFIHEHYTPGGMAGQIHGRMYFTPANGARIDAVRARLAGWMQDGSLDEDAYHTLLAALLEAADRVANTTGVYAAFVKTWQSNALRPLELRVPPLVHGNGCRSARGDALQTVRDAGQFDLLYLDPPYNSRQYAGYYHIPELIARGWFDEPVETRGKTGLLDDADKRSDWSRSRRCEAAFEELVASARCRHIVMSYNSEGIIPERTIERVLRQHGRRWTYRRYRYTYRRYRADADGVNRQYRGDTVDEYLYCVSR